MKKQTKSQKILAMLDKGMTAVQIAEKLGIKPAYVYTVKSNAKNKARSNWSQAERKEIEASVAETLAEIAHTDAAKTPDEVQVGGAHYKDNEIQVWDAIHDWGLGYFSGNVVKYVARHQKKNGLEDLKKARHYLDKLISIAEKQGEE